LTHLSLFPTTLATFVSKDFAEFADFAEENFYCFVSSQLRCTKMVQFATPQPKPE
jgi:hypothetical protein